MKKLILNHDFFPLIPFYVTFLLYSHIIISLFLYQSIFLLLLLNKLTLKQIYTVYSPSVPVSQLTTLPSCLPVFTNLYSSLLTTSTQLTLTRTRKLVLFMANLQKERKRIIFNSTIKKHYKHSYNDHWVTYKSSKKHPLQS